MTIKVKLSSCLFSMHRPTQISVELPPQIVEVRLYCLGGCLIVPFRIENNIWPLVVIFVSSHIEICYVIWINLHDLKSHFCNPRKWNLQKIKAYDVIICRCFITLRLSCGIALYTGRYPIIPCLLSSLFWFVMHGRYASFYVNKGIQWHWASFGRYKKSIERRKMDGSRENGVKCRKLFLQLICCVFAFSVICGVSPFVAFRHLLLFRLFLAFPAFAYFVAFPGFAAFPALAEFCGFSDKIQDTG